MLSVHLDTNAYTAFARGDEGARFICSHAQRLVVSAIVLGELQGGFGLGRHSTQNLQSLRRFMKRPRVNLAPVDQEVAARYADIYRQLRLAGTPIPTNDLWIAAVALCDPGGVLYTLDSHFQSVLGLPVVVDRESFSVHLA